MILTNIVLQGTENIQLVLLCLIIKQINIFLTFCKLLLISENIYIYIYLYYIYYI